MRRLHRIRPSVRIVVLNRVSVARRNTQAHLLLPPVHPEQGYQRGQQRGPEGGADVPALGPHALSVLEEAREEEVEGQAAEPVGREVAPAVAALVR